MGYIAKYYSNSFSAHINFQSAHISSFFAHINSYDLLYFYLKGQVTGIYCTLKQEVELEDTVKSEFERFRPVVNQEMYL